MQILDTEGRGHREDRKRQVQEKECVRGHEYIQVYIVYKVPKATAAPMQQDRVWALLFCSREWTRQVEFIY